MVREGGAPYDWSRARRDLIADIIDIITMGGLLRYFIGAIDSPEKAARVAIVAASRK